MIRMLRVSYTGIRGLQGATPEMVSQCQSAFGWDKSACELFLLDFPDIPGLTGAIIRGAILTGGTAACTYYATSQTGVPKEITGPACSYTVQKVVEYAEKFADWLFSYGGPSYRPWPGAGPEGVYWRRISGPADLQPGETFYQKGVPRAELNVATLLDGNGKPVAFVYIPCGRLRKQRTGMVVCRDKDGVVRNIGADPKPGPRYPAGAYTKRVSYAWPAEFEQTPWKSPFDILDSFRPAKGGGRAEVKDTSVRVPVPEGSSSAAVPVPEGSSSAAVPVVIGSVGAAALLWFLLR